MKDNQLQAQKRSKHSNRLLNYRNKPFETIFILNDPSNAIMMLFSASIIKPILELAGLFSH
jgi:hypothetical protein